MSEIKTGYVPNEVYKVETFGNTFKLIDTAGIRRRRSVNYGPEFFGINRSFKAIVRSDVCVLVIDALDGVTEQDQRLAGRIEEDGRACLLVINKWDAVEKNSHTMPMMERELRSKRYFLDWAPRAQEIDYPTS